MKAERRATDVKRFALIADQVRSSQSSKAATNLKPVLSAEGAEALRGAAVLPMFIACRQAEVSVVRPLRRS